MEKLVSIIIVNYNKYQDTVSCVKSLLNQSYKNFEVIVLDNGSKYDLFLNLNKSLEEFKNELNLKLIRSKRNLYYGAGNNKAIKTAKGDYICLLNFDVVLSPDYVERMVEFLEKYPNAGMISPRIKILDNEALLWNAGSFIDYKSAIVIGNRGYLEYDPHNREYTKIEEIDFAPGTAVFIRKDVINKVGLIDEIFFMYHEDPDWNFRAKKEGYKSYYVPTTTIYHNVPRIISEERMVFNHHFFTRNAQILVWKHAKILDILIFYYIFIIMNLGIIGLNILFRKMNKIKIRIISIIQGFRIGVRRRTNRSCRKYMISDYRYIKNLQKF
ncbi:MAG: glycosyltransferase family 2 protein [Candidatus Thorarchaeota archaeon]